MPVKPPPGFITRPDAAKEYKRSERALQRDLRTAQSISDDDVLGHWILVTSDGKVRPAQSIKPGDVKKLQNDGMIPTWCGSMSYFQERYGLRHAPKPASSAPGISDSKQDANTPVDEPQPHSNEPSQTTEQDSTDKIDPKLVAKASNDIPFELLRHHPYVTHLESEVKIKNEQIEGWNKLTDQFQKLQLLAQQNGILPGGSDTKDGQSSHEETKQDKVHSVVDAIITDSNEGDRSEALETATELNSNDAISVTSKKEIDHRKPPAKNVAKRKPSKPKSRTAAKRHSSAKKASLSKATKQASRKRKQHKKNATKSRETKKMKPLWQRFFDA